MCKNKENDRNKQWKKETEKLATRKRQNENSIRRSGFCLLPILSVDAVPFSHRSNESLLSKLHWLTEEWVIMIIFCIKDLKICRNIYSEHLERIFFVGVFFLFSFLLLLRTSFEIKRLLLAKLNYLHGKYANAVEFHIILLFRFILFSSSATIFFIRMGFFR